jgi:hypothetical protein
MNKDKSKWPPEPDISSGDPKADVKKIRYQAELDAAKAEFTMNFERQKADFANEYVQDQAVNSAYLDAAKTSLERSLARANFVQGAAAAVSGAYVGVLGFVFAVMKDRFLPIRGIVPTFFLGMAIFLAAVYASFMTDPEEVRVLPSDGTLHDIQRSRRNSFVLWINAIIERRREYLQASVISLGIGALLLPLPFVTISRGCVIGLLFAGVVCILIPLIRKWRSHKSK